MANQDIRLQVFITPEINERVSELARTMGLKKNEVVRTAIATYVAQWYKSVEIVGDMMKDPNVIEKLAPKK